jgi:hypothetical protein
MGGANSSFGTLLGLASTTVIQAIVAAGRKRWLPKNLKARHLRVASKVIKDGQIRYRYRSTSAVLSTQPASEAILEKARGEGADPVWAVGIVLDRGLKPALQ